MTTYYVYFKDEEAPLPLTCEVFEFHPATNQRGYRESASFKFNREDEPEPVEDKIFLNLSEVAAVIPADYDPGARGFQVYLKGKSAPLTVKADTFAEGLDYISFSSGDTSSASGRTVYENIDDIYVAASEVLAVLPENVSGGEVEEEVEVGTVEAVEPPVAPEPARRRGAKRK